MVLYSNNVIVFRGSTLTCTYLLLHTAQRRKVKAASSSDNSDSSERGGKCAYMSHTYLIICSGTIGPQGKRAPTSFVLGASVHTLSKAFEILLHIHVRSL